MELARTLDRAASSSWNPFRITGTALPPQVLLLSKLLFLCLILKHYHNLPEPFVPFFEWFPLQDHPREFRKLLQLVLGFGGFLILFNRAPRAGAFIIAAVFFTAIMSSRGYYRNAKVFVLLLMLMVSLTSRGKKPWFIWAQLSLMYFGAALNKALEPDWWSGQYFHFFLTEHYASSFYALVAPWLPGKGLAQVFGVSVIVIEFLASALLLIPRFQTKGLWLVAMMHLGALLLVFGDYGIFFTALLCSYLSFLEWPERVSVHFDPKNQRHHGFKRLVERFDFEKRFTWSEHAQATLICEHGETRVSGLQAWERVLWFLPAAYLIPVLIFAGPTGDARIIIRVAGGLVAARLLLEAKSLLSPKP